MTIQQGMDLVVTKTKEEYKKEGEEFAQKLLDKHEGWKDEQYQAAYGDLWQGVKKQDEWMRLPIEEQSRIRQQELLAYEEGKTSLAKIKTYAEMAEVQKRFVNMLGEQEGKAYIESVIIAVSNSSSLLSCTPKSIMISAMRAASLRLSVDPALRQGHLVSYGNECTFIPDYHGLVQLSINTNYYEIAPDVSEVYEGEKVVTDRFGGKVVVEGERVSDKIIGWCAYYKAKNGIERWLYWTNEQCDAHGLKYNPGGFNSKKSLWATDKDKMRRKTTLRQFMIRYGNFSPVVTSFLLRDEVLDIDGEDLPDDSDIIVQPKQASRPAGAMMAELGFT